MRMDWMISSWLVRSFGLLYLRGLCTIGMMFLHGEITESNHDIMIIDMAIFSMP